MLDQKTYTPTINCYALKEDPWRNNDKKVETEAVKVFYIPSRNMDDYKYNRGSLQAAEDWPYTWFVGIFDNSSDMSGPNFRVQMTTRMEQRFDTLKNLFLQKIELFVNLDSETNNFTDCMNHFSNHFAP